MRLVELYFRNYLFVDFILTDDFTKEDAEVVMYQIRKKFGGDEVDRMGSQRFGLKFFHQTHESIKAVDAKRLLRRMSRAGRGGFKYKAWVEPDVKGGFGS